jgi:hypothetical protein
MAAYIAIVTIWLVVSFVLAPIVGRVMKCHDSRVG